mgnify:CR=1 FL=1
MQWKPRVIKDFDKLDKSMRDQLIQLYPNGFADFLVSYTDPKTGQERFALPYETSDRYYMIRMDEFIDSQIDRIAEDDDFPKDEDLLNLEIDSIEKPADLKIEETDDEDEDETCKPKNEDDEDNDDDLDDIPVDDEEDDEDDEESDKEF